MRIALGKIPYKAAFTAGLGYFGLAAITIALTSNGRNHATVWVADALILAWLLARPRGDWPALLMAGWAANLCANALVRGWIPGLAFYATINMAQVWLAGALLARGGGTDSLMADVRTVIRFILVAGVLAPLLGGLAGSVATLANYGQPFGDSLLRWYTSNALGLLICTPFFRAAIDGSFVRAIIHSTREQRLEATALLLLHGGVTMLVFWQTRIPLLFLPYSSLLLVAFRLERLGTKAGVAMVALIGSAAAYRGLGPMGLIHAAPLARAIGFQVYLGCLMCTALTVSASVSLRRDALTRLAEREEALRLIMTHVPDVVLSFDAAGICRWATGPVERYMGCVAETLPGQSLSAIAQATGAALLTGDGPAVEFAPPHSPGTTLEASFGALPGGGNVTVLRDITARKARERAIERRAETDDLTAVLNRLGFRTRLEAMAATPGRARALAIIDIDHFKAINDSLGHTTGDRVLREIAAHLKRGVRDSDVVGRIGGDEFAILFDCPAEIARAVCERISETLRATPVTGDNHVGLIGSISCGIAALRPGMSPERWIEAADAALYEVKRAGRNGVRVAA